MRMTERKLFFITGASRSGTTLLSCVLRNQREVFGLKELQYFGQAWDPRQRQRRFSQSEAVEAAATMLARQEQGILSSNVAPRHRLEAVALVEGLGAEAADPAALFAAVVFGLTLAAGKTIPCEQTPRYIFYARALLDLYPTSRVVHIVRDPRSVMASQKMRWQRRKLAAIGVKVPLYDSLRVWVNYHPYTVARLWSRATGEALALADHPRVILIKFEDLVCDPAATVRQLCNQLDLDYDARMLDVGQINSSHQSSVGGARVGLHADAINTWKTSLTQAEISVTEQNCAHHMRRFGYESASPKPLSVARKLWLRLSYFAHLGGVVLVNPRRAYVQAQALLRIGRPAERLNLSTPASCKSAGRGDLAE